MDKTGHRTAPTHRTGAEHLVRCLIENDVDTVFGLPGVHNLPVWEALRTSAVRLINTRHEQAAAYAADGYARSTGRIGVALVTTGPGAANTLAAVGEAGASGTPLLIVATDIPDALRTPGIHRGVLHESRDQRAMFAPVVKDGWTATKADEIVPLLRRACALALSAPQGPVYLGIPADFLRASTPETPGGRPETREPLPGAGVPSGLDRALTILAGARRPLVWAGGGALRAGAHGEVARLADLLGAPVLTTYGARGLLDPGHPWYVGATAHVPEVGRLWDEADVVLAVGSDFDGMMTQNWAMPPPPCLITVNVDAADAGKNYLPDLALTGDAAHVVGLLLERLHGIARAPGERALARSRVRGANDAARATIESEEPQAALLLDALAGLPPDRILVADMCVAGYWVGGFARLPGPRSLAYPVGWGTLGFAFPAALGAAATGRRAIAICGDGGFLFACGELATAAQERLPVTVILVDDGGYGMLRYDQQVGGTPSFGVDLVSPDFVALARSFGVDAHEVTGFGEAFHRSLHAFATADGPNVLVVKATLRPPPNTSPRWYRAPHR